MPNQAQPGRADVTRSFVPRGLVGAIAVIVITIPAGGASPINAPLGAIPLHFEPNRGQARSDAVFVARAWGYTLLLQRSAIVFVLTEGRPGDSKRRREFRIGLGSGTKDIVGLDPLPGRSNCFIGNDPALWTTGIAHFARVSSTGLHPGIDLERYGVSFELSNYDRRNTVVIVRVVVMSTYFGGMGGEIVNDIGDERKEPNEETRSIVSWSLGRSRSLPGRGSICAAIQF